MTRDLTGESIRRQHGRYLVLVCRVRALCPRFMLRKKLGRGPLLRALPRDPQSDSIVALRLTLDIMVTSDSRPLSISRPLAIIHLGICVSTHRFRQTFGHD